MFFYFLKICIFSGLSAPVFSKVCFASLPLLHPMSLLTCSDQSQRGSLFTLFLYSPLLAFSSVCGLSSVRRGLWERAQEFLRKVYRDIGQMITRSRTIGISERFEWNLNIFNSISNIMFIIDWSLRASMWLYDVTLYLDL